MTVFTNNGTAANPAITNTNDTNTGVFYPAADTVAISTNGITQLAINSSGEVEVVSKISHMGDTDTYMGFPSNGTISLHTSGVGRLNIQDNGIIKVNNEFTRTRAAAYIFRGDSEGGGLVCSTNRPRNDASSVITAHYNRWVTSGETTIASCKIGFESILARDSIVNTDPAVISAGDSAGGFLNFAASSGNSGFYSGVLNISYYSRNNYSTLNRASYHFLAEDPVYNRTLASGTPVMFINGNGDLRNLNNSYGAVSDLRIKENIQDCSSQWEDIKNIRLVKYNLKVSENPELPEDYENPMMLGVIAQELEASGMDKLVDNQLEYKTVKYSVLYLKAIKALQEAMLRIEELESKVSSLS